MIIKCYNEKHPYLLFIDLEFNDKTLIQFAGLLFKKIDDEVYQLKSSYNQYITAKVCYPFMEYTNITNNFLESNGIPLKDAVSFIYEDFLNNVPLNELQVISHGLKNDRIVLQNNGINLSNYNGKPIDGYCTFNNAKRILNRVKNLKATDLAEECGYYLHNAHNAFNDVWAEVAIFTYLKKVEKQQQQQIQEVKTTNEIS